MEFPIATETRYASFHGSLLTPATMERGAHGTGLAVVLCVGSTASGCWGERNRGAGGAKPGRG